MDRIIRLLEEAGVSAYRVTRKRTEAVELYFIKKKLDLPRYKDLDEISVEIFRDFESDGEKYRGSTTIYLEPSMSEEEISRKIRDAWYAASFVKNRWYDLPEKTVSGTLPSGASCRDLPLNVVADQLADVVLTVDSDDTAFINSAEIFARRAKVRIVDSAGTDVSFVRDLIRGEFVAQCTAPEDVEQFRQFAYDDLDLKALREKLEEGIRDVRLRARAKGAPAAGSRSIILTGENLRELLNYYSARSGSAMIYPGYSTWKVGENVQGEVTTGEKLRLSLVSALPFSGEGIPMKERPLLCDGVLKTIHGNARFAFYLGIEPTGSYEKLKLEAGTMSYEDMKRSGALEAVSFSDFQMDVMDGHFAGELRLALETDEDGQVTALTGGSVNGDLISLQGRLIFSEERYKDSSYEGPLAVLIPDVMVAGNS